VTDVPIALDASACVTTEQELKLPLGAVVVVLADVLVVVLLDELVVVAPEVLVVVVPDELLVVAPAVLGDEEPHAEKRKASDATTVAIATPPGCRCCLTRTLHQTASGT
jgi:hypothetical protein